MAERLLRLVEQARVRIAITACSATSAQLDLLFQKAPAAARRLQRADRTALGSIGAKRSSAADRVAARDRCRRHVAVVDVGVHEDLVLEDRERRRSSV
jgi:hypothetical protein